MSKVKRITVSNFKAIEHQNIDLNGCSAIVVAANDKGKSSLLKGLFDRMAGTKAAKVVRDGQTDGTYEMELTTGEKLLWQFSEGEKGFKEKLTYITEKDIKTSLTTELRNKFAPATFDVDEFLAATPAAQRKTLQDLAGLDFTIIDAKYDTAYKERTAANTRAADAKTLFESQVAPAKVEKIDTAALSNEKEKIRTELNNQYLANKKKNDDARVVWNNGVDKFHNDVQKWNEDGQAKNDLIQTCTELMDALYVKGYAGKEVEQFIDSLPVGLPHTFTKPGEPTYIQELPDNKPMVDIEEKITSAIEQNKNADLYTSWLSLQSKVVDSKNLALEADKKVQAITRERLDLIKTANMPEGFAFTDDSITYNGLAFTREQLSSSGIYIASLKLGSMKIGEIRTLHFDASFLDNKSLSDIEAWAATQDLQLLVEQPDRAGGEITYELLA